MRTELVAVLAPQGVAEGESHPWVAGEDVRVPGGASRWSKGKDWLPLTPSLVVEVAYDQMEAERFRHTAGFVRWRPDRESSSCTYEQVPSIEASTIEELLAASSVGRGS
jgi:ATP-dependent DNA ligase